MKLLVYEPGSAGHRSVYLRYVTEALSEAKNEVRVVTDDYARMPLNLVHLAVRNSCEMIFICTLDGLFGWLVLLGLAANLHGIKVVGIYFLFNNLYEGWKGVLWRGVLRGNVLHHVFTPDLQIQTRNTHPGLRGRVSYLPDVWNRQLHMEIDRVQAAGRCGLQPGNNCVMLVFGELSARKGVGLLIETLEVWDYGRRPKLVILLAGRLSPDVRRRIKDLFATRPDASARVCVVDQWIHEKEVAAFFSAASYLCALYPENFRVSISTVIKAFAVRRPVIVGMHGMIGQLVGRDGSGFLCDTRSVLSVRGALEEAYDTYFYRPLRYRALSEAGSPIAEGSELKEFKAALTDWSARHADDDAEDLVRI